MTRVKTIESVLKMKFEEVYGRFCAGELTTEEAASLLFISSRTFLRKLNHSEELEKMRRVKRSYETK